MQSIIRRTFAGGVMGAVMALAPSAQAIEIGVVNYGGGPSGYAYAVALEKGFFKEAGVDITAIQGSQGGGSDVRIMLAGDLPYFEGTIGPIVTAIQKGADLKIISMNTNNSATAQWVVKPDSPIKSFKDLKGKKVGFTNAQSFTQATLLWLLAKFGFKDGDVITQSTGGFGPGLTLLDHDGIDVAVITEPQISTNAVDHKYRVILSGDDESVFEPSSNTVGFVSTKYAKEHPDIIRAIVAGRRKAVDYMAANPKDAAAIIATRFKVDASVVEASIIRLTTKGTLKGVPVFGTAFSYPALESGLQLARLVGVIQGDVDLKSMIDESYLPDDLKTKK